MYIETVTFPGIAIDRLDLSPFFSNAAFVISHKSEHLETLLDVLWYLPSQSPIIVVTNCPAGELATIARGLDERMVDHGNLYLVHQKDASIAAIFRDLGVFHLLGEDGSVASGKGEGMYIGTLCAALLANPQWVVFYDADNFVPSALIEYTIAMGRLFLAAGSAREGYVYGGSGEYAAQAGDVIRPALHNVRICWASKPAIDGGEVGTRVLGRCTRVVSPLVNALFREHGAYPAIITSNAGEQGMTMRSAKTLRFASNYSVETLQLLDLFAHGLSGESGQVLFQQYEARSPHFHQKGDEQHIARMIAQSLGCFECFADLVPQRVQEAVYRACEVRQISPDRPRVYPSLDSLGVKGDPAFLQRYRPALVALAARDLTGSLLAAREYPVR